MTVRYDDVIRSPDNQAIKFVRSLRQRSVREAERAFVVEGRRAVDDALLAGGRARFVLVREAAEWTPPVLGPFPVRPVTARVFDRLAETETPQAVLAVFEFPDQVEPSGVPLLLVADGIADPGNLGTLIRSAAGAGATAVVLTPGTVDPYNGKVVRSAMGAHFRVPIHTVRDRTDRQVGVCLRYVLADAQATADYAAFDWAGPVAIIVGSEAHGPTPFGRRLATDAVRIPLANGVESLNAAAAGAILLFEAARQRRVATSG
jgi:TrmH family RNA methyltransferase